MKWEPIRADFFYHAKDFRSLTYAEIYLSMVVIFLEIVI